MNIGERIKDLRKNKELTFREVSEMTGMSTGYLSNIEKNNKRPSVKTLEKLAGAFKVPVAYFTDDSYLDMYSILKHLPDDIKEMVINSQDTPYLKLAKEAKDHDFTPEQIDALVQLIRANIPKKVE